MTNIENNLTQIKHLMSQAEANAGRSPNEVLLVAVSKKQNADAIREAHRYGVTHFAENYVQEAVMKMDELAHLPLNWHFIGPIQSNKTKAIAARFHWVHSINRLEVALKLNQFRAAPLEPLNVCIQINLVDEPTKSGIAPEEAAALAQAIEQLPHLRLRGLMIIPPPQSNENQQYALFLQLKQLMHDLNQQNNLTMDTLSMGMSDDFVPAIKAGSTLIRVGRALFGERSS